ncbi:hypothetical protein G9A89_001854 [Geosiphon pyriformis]|nr:hypothetical protein G9A89_001854 [Geosiphon pyriformis]
MGNCISIDPNHNKASNSVGGHNFILLKNNNDPNTNNATKSNVFKKYKDGTTKKNTEQISLDKADSLRFQIFENPIYPVPSMEENMDRLQLLHYTIRYIWQSNFSSPILDQLKFSGGRVLDIGCGNGTWALEIANDFPKTTVIGLDLKKIPKDQKKTENLAFFEADVLDGLPFEDCTFDLVHIRHLVNAFTSTQWERNVIPEMVRVTKPGGWIEICETDLKFFNDGPTSQKLMSAFRTLNQSQGVMTIITPFIPKFIQATKQTTHIQTMTRDVPIGSWAGNTGLMAIKDTILTFNAAPNLAAILNVSQEKFAELLNEMTDEMDKNRAFYRNFRFYAQKI